MSLTFLSFILCFGTSSVLAFIRTLCYLCAPVRCQSTMTSFISRSTSLRPVDHVTIVNGFFKHLWVIIRQQPWQNVRDATSLPIHSLELFKLLQHNAKGLSRRSRGISNKVKNRYIMTWRNLNGTVVRPTLRRARLILGWVTVYGRVNHLGITSHPRQLSLSSFLGR